MCVDVHLPPAEKTAWTHRHRPLSASFKSPPFLLHAQWGALWWAAITHAVRWGRGATQCLQHARRQ